MIWYLRLFCCEREDGISLHSTWEEADRTRETYCNAGGHRRVAVLDCVAVPMKDGE